MAIYRLIRIFRSASAFAVLKPEIEWPTGCAVPDQYEHHYKIITFGKIGAAVGFMAGLGIAYELFMHPHQPTLGGDDLFKIILVPFLAIVCGMLSGACWTGVFAPKSFLSSPAGIYWSALIHAESPATARGKSLIIAVITTAFFIFCAVCVAIGKV